MAQTNVTGVAKDSQSTPYINGTWTVNLFNPTTFQPVWQGSTSFTTSYGGALDSTGAFAVTLPSNTGAGSITVGGLTTTQWTFAFFTSDGENGYSSTITITGASQVVTGSIVNAGRIKWSVGATNAPSCGIGQAVVSLGAGLNGCATAGGGGTVAGTYTNIKTNATTTVKSGTGTLFTIQVNNPGSGWSFTLFDNTAGSGTTIGTTTSLSGLAGITLAYNDTFNTGLTIVTAGTTPGDITVSWS